MTTAQKLELFIKYFKNRTDVYTIKHRVQDFLTPTEIKNFSDFLPDDVLEFYKVCNGLTFQWVHTEHVEDKDQYSEGYNGGYLNLIKINSVKYYPPEDYEEDDNDFVGQMMLDNLQPEGFTQLQYSQGKTPKDAYCAFNNANDCTIEYICKFDEYIQRACQNAFTWYWPANDWEGEEIKNKLFESSEDINTSKSDIIKKYVDLGMNEIEATEMFEWLGKSAVLLLQKI